MGTPGKSRKQESTGWIMMQYSLEGAHQNPHKVINTVYKSSHAKTWVEARSYAIAGADQEDIEISVDAPVPAPAVSKASGARFRATAVQKGKAALAVAAVSRDGEKADATQLSLTRGIPIDLLLQAARKAVHCVDYKEAVQIKEFEAAKLIYHTSMTELGLDSTILSGSLIQLDLLIQHVAMTKELTPNGRDHLVCLAEGMSGTIFSEYLNELPTRGRQAFNALERLGVDVQEALQMPSKGMKISPLVIPDGEAKDFALEFLLSAAALVAAGNKRPIPASFTAASSSGVKRLRQERTETTSPIATLEEAQRHLMPDEYPVDGGDKAEDYTEMYANMLRDKITPIGGGGGGGADGFVVAIPEGEGYPAGFFYMPGVADNLEEPVGAHGFPGGVVALAPHMAEPPSAPCRFPEESDLHQFALKDSACRSLVGAEDSAPGTAFRYYDDFSANNGTGGSTDYPNGGAAGSNGLAAGGGERQVHDLPMDIDGLSDLEDIDMFDIDEYLAMPEF
ncbi:uncharacterized protein LOC104583394 [Brachypodium distachyon]|uniref:NAC domain-containing protein n=1 Tax=Brachypodium distachyon TaxID=15368 RepID=A0A0Q3KLU4_BRADI|nr:uncharacterized protein LOC104583394 [Brachypodium distachyon]XP_024313021.1 uncharacterized protein LOC104583394 [Brachypodium distachyon]XP_024313022.1 uncharacterized protein LOC104583394 [Brachypodium distachyon]KQK12105.1 hypothetical protein BRADI_1g01656v3 [Brachypodium distachyon]KQK12106.1 hypothetical protein BRADI_1g01656v3 [Brachypodium distachyon]|eukprot:XP_024313020.1 uncharacterized protein LOC104583394 [Brachypodium distachyon]